MTPSRIPTLIAQATVGCFGGYVVLILARMVLVPRPYNVEFVFAVPCALFFSPVLGIPAGLAIWILSRFTDCPLPRVYRSVVGVSILALFWSGYALLAPSYVASAQQQSWLIAAILIPGRAIGWITNSRLKVWHEFVRPGESTGTMARFCAAVSGLILRPLVVVLFIISLVALIGFFQSPAAQKEDAVWALLFLCHFACACALLFWRVRTAVLLPLALLVNVPMILSVFEYRYFVHDFRPVPLVYLAVWMVFLLSRWRQTRFALSFLNKEIHYYLID